MFRGYFSREPFSKSSHRFEEFVSESYQTVRRIASVIRFQTVRVVNKTVSSDFQTLRSVVWSVSKSYQTVVTKIKSVTENYQLVRNVFKLITASFQTLRLPVRSVYQSFQTLRYIFRGHLAGVKLLASLRDKVYLLGSIRRGRR